MLVFLTKYQFYQIGDRLIFFVNIFFKEFPFLKSEKIAGLKIVEFTYWLKNAMQSVFIQKTHADELFVMVSEAKILQPTTRVASDVYCRIDRWTWPIKLSCDRVTNLVATGNTSALRRLLNVEYQKPLDSSNENHIIIFLCQAEVLSTVTTVIWKFNFYSLEYGT